jgi:NADH-quinone oxidoreductase subunit M
VVSPEPDFTLVLMTFAPTATALMLMMFPAQVARWMALLGAIVTALLSLRFLGPMTAMTGAAGSLEEYAAFFVREWIPEWGIRFSLGLDGLSGTLVLLTNFLVIVSILASWTAIERRQKEFYAFLLVLQTGILGTFLALDLFLFYIFWELMLVPLYLMIGIFGSGRRIYAAMKFFLYTMAGSVLMLLGIIALHFQAHIIEPGLRTFGLPEFLRIAPQIPEHLQMLIFFSFFLAFAIKVPLFPFHTWLPDAHTEAPTAGSIILAGVLLKTGVYGMMRFAIPLFPAVAATYADPISVLALIAIIYGALTAIVQKDMKRLVAYSSVSHMGFIVLGLFAFGTEAVTGAALQMVNHGISTGALFFCVGVLYERRHTRLLSEFGGLAYNMKIYTVLTVIVVLSSVGLPGLNGFVGEFLILLGSFQVRPWLTAGAATGVILAAVYLLRMTQLTFFGPLDNDDNKDLKDLNAREAFALIALIVFAFWIGLYPRPYLKLLEPASAQLVTQVQEAKAAQAAADLAESEVEIEPISAHAGIRFL